MEEISKTEAIPEDAPWKKSWQEIAKSSGTYNPAPEEQTYAQKVLSEGVNPWLVDWGRFRQDVPLKATDRPERFVSDVEVPQVSKSKQTPPRASNGVLDFDTVLGNLIQAESRGRHTDKKGNLTTSPVGARGITQVMRKTGEDPGYGVAPLKDESENEYVRFGRDYLKAMLKEFGGDYRKALAAYNYGPGAVRKAISASNRSGGDWLSHTPSETRSYVAKVLGTRRINAMNEEPTGGLISAIGSTSEDGYRELPSISIRDLRDTGLLTKAGRAAYQAKWEQEAVKNKKSKSTWTDYAEKDNPVLFSAFDTLQGVSDIPSRVVNSERYLNQKVSFPREGGSPGFTLTDDKEDGRIFLDYGADFSTLVHEATHVDQIQLDKRDRVLAEREKLKSITSPIRKLFTLIDRDPDNIEFRKVFRASNALDNAEEFMANFQGYMQASIPEGMSWSQTPFYKELVRKTSEKEAQTMIIDMMTTLVRKKVNKTEVNSAEKR